MQKIVFFILLVVTVFNGTAAYAKETITIVADEWCPYNCGERAAKQGYMVDIIRAAMKKADIDVVYKVIPWKKAVEKTRAGKFDAIVGANIGDAGDFIFPEQIQGISINQVWVKNDAAWTYEGLNSLDGLKIGVVDGYSYGKGIDTYLEKRLNDGSGDIIIDNSTNATESNIKKLLTGKIDVMLEDKSVIEYYFTSRAKPMLLKPVGNPVEASNHEDTYIFVAFGPHKPDAKRYAELLAKGMQEMRENGELKTILARYDMNGLFRFTGIDTGAE